MKIDNETGKVNVSVVIPAYNEELVIAKTLESITKQDYPGTIELVICDNNSTDRTAEICREYGAKVVLETRKGTRFAYDAAMRHSTGELILATNADVILPPNWISSIVAAYEDPEVVGVGTRVRYYNTPSWINSFMDFSDLISPKRAMWGTSLSCRRWVYNKVGGFNHGVNTNEDAIFTLLIEKLGTVKILDSLTVLMDGRRYNQGFWNTAKEWLTGIGTNGIYIQLNYVLFGKITSLINDFGDIRSTVFGKGEKTQITVIIPVDNDQEYIAQVLTSLQLQDFDYKFKIIVLDNFSVDLTMDIAKVFPNVFTVTYPKIYNYAQRLSTLISEIDSPVVALTTPQAELPGDWLSNIYNEFNKQRKVELDILSGPYTDEGAKLISTITNEPLDKLSSNIELNNFAIKTDKLKQILPQTGSLESVEKYIASEVIKKDFQIHYSLNFKAFHRRKGAISSIIDNSGKTLRHTFKKLVKPITKRYPTPQPQD